MLRPSILQSLGGPLGGQRLEFRGGDVVIGSAPDCAVRIDAPGVEAHHARIVIEITGAMVHRVDGVVGVNDDVVMGDALLRSGDFVWIGEPGGVSSIMLQFTLGDVDDTSAEPSPGTHAPVPPALVEEGAPEDLPSQDEVLEEVPVEAPPEAVALEVEDHPEPAPLLDFQPDEPMRLDALTPKLEALPAELEALPAELEPVSEIDSAFEPPLDVSPADLSPESAPVVPPAPWQLPSAPSPEEVPPAEYASAWESAPAKPAAPETAPTPEPVEGTTPLQDLTPAPPPAPTPAPIWAPPVRKRPSAASAAKAKSRKVEQEAALRTPPPRTDPPRTPPPPPPPARTTSSTPMVVGGLVALAVLGTAGFLLLRPAPAVVSPKPAPTRAPVPTPVAATPEPTPEAAQVAVVEPTPVPSAPPVAVPVAPIPVAGTPRARTTPTPRATPALRTALAPAAAQPGAPVAPPVAVAAAPVSQAPRLLEEARGAVAARDLTRAAYLLDQVLKVEPGNSEATARKAEVDSRLALLGRKFSVGATSVIGGKTTKKGPSGFDLGGGAVVQTDFSAQIRCATIPASLDFGTRYSVRCSILNIGTKPFRLESVAANETLDGARTTGAGVAPRQDIAPQSDAVILERQGTWNTKSQWSLELVAKTTKDESFRAIYSWR